MAVIRLTITAALYGSIHQNVLHFEITNYTTPKLSPFVDAVSQFWMDQYRNFWVAETQFLSLKGEVLTSLGVGDTKTLPITLAGGSVNDRRVPLNLAQVIQLTTGLAGKANRGRIYAGGTTVNAILDGTFTTSHLNSANGWLVTLMNRWVLPNRTAEAAIVIHGKNDAHDAFRPVTNMALRVTPGSQRRRMIGVGI